MKVRIKALDLGIDSYCLRITKKMNNQPAMMIINISDSFIRSAMQSLDLEREAM